MADKQDGGGGKHVANAEVSTRTAKDGGTVTEVIMDRIPARILVHKDGEEGVIEVQGRTGVVMTKQGPDLPEWAEGFVYANLAERTRFYETRLGSAFTVGMRHPEVMCAQDLEWIGLSVDNPDLEMIVEADPDFRQGVMATVLGVDRAEDIDKAIAGVSAEVWTDNDIERTVAEERAMTEALQGAVFGEQQEAAAKKTG